MVNRLPQQEKVNAYFQSRLSFWREIYASGGVFAEIIQDRHATVLAWVESLALPPGSQVLEVGCGAGFMALALAQRGFRVHAIDSVESMIEQAQLTRRVKHTLEWLGLRRRTLDPPLSMTYHYNRFIDEALARVELIKTKGITHAFEFSICYRHKVFPDP